MSRADHHHLPPLPSRLAPSAKSCAVVRLYLAVEDNLSADQLQIIAAHIQLCSDCAHEQQIFRRASLLVATLNTAYPSERVNQAVMTAITTRGQYNNVYTPHHSFAAPRSGHLRRAISLGAVAASWRWHCPFPYFGLLIVASKDTHRQP